MKTEPQNPIGLDIASSPSALPELQGVREKQEALVVANPYTVITDAASYGVAKKHRTALVKGRTDLQKDKVVINKKIAEFKTAVDTETSNLIAITLPHETKQQEEVKRYEAAKEAEKQAKIELERKRKEALRSQVIGFRDAKRAAIEVATFKTIDAIISDIESADLKVEEFQEDFVSIKETILNEAKKKQVQLAKEEDLRLERIEQAKERERLAAERKKLDEERAIAERERKKREAAEATKRKEEEEKLAAERKVLDDERKKEEAKLAEDRKKLEEEKAAVENERKAREAEEEKKREEERKKLEAEKAELKRQEEARQAEIAANLKAEREAKEKAELERRVEMVQALGYKYDGTNLFTYGNIVVELFELKEEGFTVNLEQFAKLLNDESARLEALKPDCDKLNHLIGSFRLVALPDVKQPESQSLVKQFSADLEILLNSYQTLINEL